MSPSALEYGLTLFLLTTAIPVVAQDKPTLEIGWPNAHSVISLGDDPDSDSCNVPGRPYNSMNSDFGGDLIKARFGHCPSPIGTHVIGILLADDHHQPIVVDGKPVTALVTVTTK